MYTEIKDSFIKIIRTHIKSEHCTVTNWKQFVYESILEKVEADKRPRLTRPIIKVIYPNNPKGASLSRKDTVITVASIGATVAIVSFIISYIVARG